MLNQQVHPMLDKVSQMLEPFKLSVLSIQDDLFLIRSCEASVFFLVDPVYFNEFTYITPLWLEEYIPNCVLNPYRIEILPGGDVRDYSPSVKPST